MVKYNVSKNEAMQFIKPFLGKGVLATINIVKKGVFNKEVLVDEIDETNFTSLSIWNKNKFLNIFKMGKDNFTISNSED